MNHIRLEKYGATTNDFPFSLGVDLYRTPYNLSKEQNWHENIEIQLCTCGEGTVLLDGKEYLFEKDDILVVNSNVLHYTRTSSNLTYTCLIVSTDWCRQMHIHYDTLLFSPCVQNKKINQLMGDLVCVYNDSNDPLQIARSNHILLQIMIELIDNHASSRSFIRERGDHFDIVKSTVTFIHQNHNRKMTLKEISENVSFDKYALCKEFKKYTGSTIFEYINQYRAQKALDLLLAGHTVSESAFLCGFENLSFFTKTFKKYIGKMPSEYKIRQEGISE